MKILIATGLYPPEIGGPATYTRFLEDKLPEHGIEVEVVPFSSVRMFPRGIRHISYFFLLIFKMRKINVIIALDPISVGIPALCIAKILRKPFLLRVAGDYAWEQAVGKYGITESLDTFVRHTEGNPFFIKLLKRLETLVAVHATRVIVPSAYLSKIVSKWGVPKTKIVVIKNSFDVPKNIADKEVLRKLMDIKGRLIVSVGRLVPWKGFEALIYAFKELHANIPDPTLFIIGSGPDADKLSSIVSKERLGNSVIFVGDLEREVLLRYIKASDLFVLNTFYEGFSHQILEAMALGVPVVTTKIGGNPELIRDEKEGVLINYNDKRALIKAIERVLTNKLYAKNISEQGERRARTFTATRAINSFVTVLKETP